MPELKDGDPVASFDEDVLVGRRIDFEKFAQVLSISMLELARILGEPVDNLNASPTAEHTQKAATKLLKMMNTLAAFTQERRFALYWLRTPQKQLAGVTALAWMQEGRLDDVIHFVAALTDYEPD